MFVDSALIIEARWLELIIAGDKVWEMRDTNCKKSERTRLRRHIHLHGCVELRLLFGRIRHSPLPLCGFDLRESADSQSDSGQV